MKNANPPTTFKQYLLQNTYIHTTQNKTKTQKAGKSKLLEFSLNDYDYQNKKVEHNN